MPHGRVRPFLPILTAFVVSIVGIGPVAAGGSAHSTKVREPGCGPTFERLRTGDPGFGDNVLEGIDAASDDDVWAVGRSLFSPSYQTLTEHWDGTSWSVVPSPNLGGLTNDLEDVAAVSATDAWAVGWFADPNVARTVGLVLHWDGQAWDATPIHDGRGSNALHGVSAVGPNDVWAVGESGAEHGLAVHWDGSTWSVVPTPSFHESTTFWAIEAISADDVWIAGASVRSFFLHWDGSTWTVFHSAVPSAPALGLSAVSSDDVWAVGNDSDSTMTQHWDGTSWSVVPSWNIGGTRSLLFDVAAVGPNDVWAVGDNWKDGSMVQHWDGVRWSLLGDPDIPSSNLLGVAATPDRHVWVAGFGPGQGRSLIERVCPDQVRDEGFDPAVIHATESGGVAWQIDPASHGVHTVTDDSGLGLFYSGIKGPGDGFTFDYFSAGTYLVIDGRSGQLASVEVSVRVDPDTGPIGGSFRIHWAWDRLPPPYVADVQIKRPGSQEFVDWLTDQTSFAATFVPDAGPGTYEFRALVRNSIYGAVSDYSPAASIDVG
jgi:hypothetical protein